MDRAGWDTDRSFQGGIFSGGTDTREGQSVNRHQGGEPKVAYQRVTYGSMNSCNGCCGQCVRKKENGQTAIIVMAIVAMVALLLAFMTVLLCLMLIATDKTGQDSAEAVYEEIIPQAPVMPAVPVTPYGSQIPYEEEIPKEPIPTVPYENWNGLIPESGKRDTSEYYMELEDAIRTDLSYTIEWKNYEYPGNNEYVMIAVDYPVITGDIPNLELLNEKIAEEIQYFEDYYAEYSKYMLPDEAFVVYAEGYVTYMDENVMSVVFSESIYTDYWVDCGLYCLNMDMENGILLDNSSIIKIDDAFAIDFRIRSREQNGTIRELEYLSDQEVAQYLSNEGTSILFYTPLGMEVGLNYGESYVTVTYKDFDKYLKKY